MLDMLLVYLKLMCAYKLHI